MTRGAQKRTGGLEALDPLVYGSDDAITEMCATYNLGGVTEPSREDLAVMQQGQYILRAHGGRLSKVPAEKTLLPFDPVVNYQQVHAVMGAEGTIYFSHGSTLSKSSDGSALVFTQTNNTIIRFVSTTDNTMSYVFLYTG